MDPNSQARQNQGLVDKAGATDLTPEVDRAREAPMIDTQPITAGNREIVGKLDAPPVANANDPVVVPIAPMFLIRYIKASAIIGGAPKMTCSIGYLIDSDNQKPGFENVILHGFYHYGEPAAAGEQPPITSAGLIQTIAKKDVLDIHPLIPLQAVDPKEADAIRKQLGFVTRP